MDKLTEMYERMQASHSTAERPTPLEVILPIDVVCAVIYPGYDVGIGGFEQRQEVRDHMRDIYDTLRTDSPIETYAAVIAQLRIEMGLEV